MFNRKYEDFHMNDREQSLDFKTYLASLTHDMKNSLGMLLNTTDEILSRCSSPACPSQALLTGLQYESRRLNGNLIQLLTLYKMEQSQLALNIDHHRLLDFIEEIIVYNQPQLQSKGIGLEVSCPDDLYGFFDLDLIASVLNNIINNAFKYTRDTINIFIEKNTEGYLVIEIRDNGEGYPEYLLHRNPDTPLKNTFIPGGTGLGLYFAHSILKLHKNKDRAGYFLIRNSETSPGGRFTLFLP
jgi:signal transduction histidine kinase